MGHSRSWIFAPAVALLLLQSFAPIAWAEDQEAIDALPLCSSLGVQTPPPSSSAPKPSTPAPSLPTTMQPTVYDDGMSCPGGCQESHVVFDPRINGTTRAYDKTNSNPDANPPKIEKCKLHSQCHICFGDNTECMDIKYEGAGPPYGKFDFPVVFYKENCKKQGLPQPLVKECAGFQKKVDEIENGMKIGSKINCFEKRSDPACADLMADADASKKADQPMMDSCKKQTLGVFNGKQSSSSSKRYEDCNYSQDKKAFRSSKNGVACKREWHVLLPAACPKGSYAGKYGLDCCGGSPWWRATLGGDCDAFFPSQTPVAKPVSIPVAPPVTTPASSEPARTGGFAPVENSSGGIR